MNIIDSMLAKRGKDTEFLEASPSIIDTIKLEDADKAIELIESHMKNNNHILIYGDYDCDGTTASAVAMEAFRLCGYDNVSVFINSRRHGNGINDALLMTLASRPEVKLVYTVDHGSSNEEYIKAIRNMGIDVIITDHHTLRDNTPPPSANVFVNPQKEKSDRNKNLSGCAVSYFVLFELIKKHNPKITHVNRMMPLVAISTIGDMMDMSDLLNRAICKLGIKLLNKENYVRLLKEKNNISSITSKEISFAIVPMINSCSRENESHVAYDTLHTFLSPDKSKDEMFVYEWATLSEIDSERKKRQHKIITKDMLDQISDTDWGNMILVDDAAAGLNGIISSQIGRLNNKPTITFIVGKETSTGSCRGVIDRMNVKSMFEYVDSKDSGIFVSDGVDKKYGGHHGAGGCTIYTSKIYDFKKYYEEYLKINLIKYELDSDEILSLAEDISELMDVDKLLDSIKVLGAYGNKWEMPLLSVKPERLVEKAKYTLNLTSKSIRYEFKINDIPVKAIRIAGIDDDIEAKDKILVGRLESYKGSVQFKIEHIIDK